MILVYVFISTGRFRGFADMRAFIDETYTADGDGIPSPFMREIELKGYEPGCIEAIHSERVDSASHAAGLSKLRDPVGRYRLARRPGHRCGHLCIRAECGLSAKKSSLTYVGTFELHHVPR